MTVERFFFFSLSLITFIYAIKVQISLFLDRDKVKETKGRIVNIEYVLPEIMMHRNAKLATFEYFVDGRRYISENNIKMSLSANIGDIIDIKYLKDNPSILYTKTKMYFYLSILTSFICLLLGLIIY
ncbi:hypothetical protein KQI42_10245 [Tissierella sp. MSJ-40]|uniref:DUF3592 domain-containing protein n=1 Tax=Tissierella simiarum TaxID=2841534 RepID=A0ABS6E639_9FIRM|nr:hypothetical protein [Tissierella simiarum]MBU5438390.1 hypothetical protein [Tissierella simiarum]